MTEEILVSSRSFGAAAVVLPTCTEGGEWPDRDEMIKIR